MCEMTHLCEHSYVKWLIYVSTCEMTHLREHSLILLDMCVYQHMSRMNESCHIWMCHVTYECVTSHINESRRYVVVSAHVTSEWVMSHMNESCHIWMGHVTYEWLISRMNESCYIWMSHVTCEWVMSHINESCHVWMSHATYEWVTSHDFAVTYRRIRALWYE